MGRAPYPRRQLLRAILKSDPPSTAHHDCYRVIIGAFDGITPRAVPDFVIESIARRPPLSVSQQWGERSAEGPSLAIRAPPSISRGKARTVHGRGARADETTVQAA